MKKKPSPFSPVREPPKPLCHMSSSLKKKLWALNVYKGIKIVETSKQKPGKTSYRVSIEDDANA